jgi:hypothetical protein
VGRKILATLRMPMRRVKIGPTFTVRWRVPQKLPNRSLQFCVVAVDPVGHRSRRACATLTVS